MGRRIDDAGVTIETLESIDGRLYEIVQLLEAILAKLTEGKP